MNQISSTIIRISFFFLLPLFGICQQPTKEDLTRQKQQIQKEIDDLNASLKSVQNNKSKAMKIMSIINSKVEARERLVNNINKEIKRIEEEAFLNEREIYRLKKELDTLKMKYAQSIVFAYKNRSNYQYLNFLFSSNDFNDAIKRVTYLKSYRQLRETEAQTITKTQELLQSNIVKLNVNREDKKGALLSQSEQLKALEQDKREKDETVKQLRGQEKEINAQISKKEKQRRELNNAINAAIKREIAEAEKREKERLAKLKATEDLKRKQLEAEAAAAKAAAAKAKADADAKSKADAAVKAEADAKAKKAEDDAKKAEQKSVAYNAANPTPAAGKNIIMPDGKSRDYSVFEGTKEGMNLSIKFEENKRRLPWPVITGTICGRFGTEQLGPQMKVQHDGILICCPVGTTVKAVADGEVTFIMNLDEYKCVMVRHGRYATVYNRMTDVTVTKGQKVTAGTLLGKAAIGDEGDGEFEFRVVDGNNRSVNPEIWLKPR
jgi:septal ring factor EnvC (AmiA/AmiB activator)